MRIMKAGIHCFALILLFQYSYGQPVINPGDMAIIGLNSDLGPCGEPAGTDEISIVTFIDLPTGVTFDLTDNAWEYHAPGQWGGTEGTIRITRDGPPVPAGSIITIYCRNTPPEGTYQVVNPDDQWTVTYINPGGGPLNHENGSDQLYILHGGDWVNHFPEAEYIDGNVIHGFNTLPTWNSDGTESQSNLHPDVDPCYYTTLNFGPVEFVKYAGPAGAANQLDWMDRITDPSNWNTYNNCSHYAGSPPDYVFTITSFDVTPIEISLSCFVCEACPPINEAIFFNLPPGEFNIVYTDGTDTFELNFVKDGHWEGHVIDSTTTFTLLSVQEYFQPCPVPLTEVEPLEVIAPSSNPGVYTTLLQCPNGGPIMLFDYLDGNPDSGGTWVPPIFFNEWYSPPAHGEGLFTYITEAPPCGKDTASIFISFPSDSATVLDVSCDQNGTPYDIEDDRIVINLTFSAEPFGDSIILSLSDGTITPDEGHPDELITAYLEPGSATGDPVTLMVRGVYYPFCRFFYEIEPPGFCSDPCDTLQYASWGGNATLCLNDCPAEPVSFNLDISGGTPPFRMDFSISASGFPTWQFNDVETEDNKEIQICLTDAAEPSYDPSTGELLIPETLAGNTVNIRLLEVFDYYDCTGPVQPSVFQLDLKKIPEINAYSFAICDEDADPYDLTLLEPFITDQFIVSWFDGDPQESGIPIIDPYFANLDNVAELWAQVYDGFCYNRTQVNVTLNPTPQLEALDTMYLCEGDVLDLGDIQINDGNNSMASYTFHDSLPPDSTNIINPLLVSPTDTTTIFVHAATAAMCYDTIPFDIIVEDIPTFSLAGLPCDLQNDTYSILFQSPADTVIANAGTVINHPSGQDSIVGIPNATAVFIQMESATGLCIDTLTIQAPDCNCPEISAPQPVTDTFEICADEAIPQLEVNVEAGYQVNWFTQLSGGTLLAENSSVYQPPDAVTGTYYAEAVDTSTGCYSLRQPVHLQVHDLAELANVPDQTLCENESLDLAVLTPAVLNGLAGNGQWYHSATGQPVNGTIQPSDGDVYRYTFVSSQGQCESETGFTVTVGALPDFSLQQVDCIDSSLTYQVMFISDADNIIVSNGMLTQLSPQEYLLENLPFDADFQIDLEFISSGCDTTIAFSAPDCSCPPLLESSAFMACDYDGNIDLGQFAGPGVEGTWRIVSTPPGSQPATLTGDQFSGQDADAGLYILEFIRSIILQDCIDTAAFELTLQAAPEANATGDLTICGDEIVSLNGEAAGDNITFTWMTTGTGTLSDPGSSDPTYNPSVDDILDGAVTFDFVVQDPSGFCAPDTAHLDIEINNSAFFILDAGAQIYCDTTDIVIDLDNLISEGVTSGEWYFPDTVPDIITGSSMFNPSEMEVGSYTLFYRTTSATPPCADDTATVSLVIENCSCPSVTINQPGSAICNGTPHEDLTQYMVTNESGTWTIVNTPAGSNPATVVGNTLEVEGADGGIYTLRFTLANPVQGCPEFAEIMLEVVEYPILEIVSSQCADDLQSWELVIFSNGMDIDHTEGTLVPQLDDHYLIESIPLDTDIEVVAANGNTLCITSLDALAPNCTCTLDVTNLPDNATICPGDTITLEALVSGGNGPVSVYWLVDGEPVTGNSLTVASDGIYTFIAEDELGCVFERNVEVALYDEMEVEATAVDITCPGDEDGMLVIHNITGGSSPFFIAINGGTLQEIPVFPVSYENFGEGEIAIEIQDGFGCVTTFDLEIQAANPQILDLGPDQTILLGDSVHLDPVISFIPNVFQWTGDTFSIMTGQIEQWIAPTENISLQLTAIDEDSCVYTDDILVRVKVVSSLYIPNVFSPNNDGINDQIVPLTDGTIDEIREFAIYDRWGEVVFRNSNFQPDDPQSGWNGQVDGKPALPGVYVYSLSATNSKGVSINLKGDLTLVR